MAEYIKIKVKLSLNFPQWLVNLFDKIQAAHENGQHTRQLLLQDNITVFPFHSFFKNQCWFKFFINITNSKLYEFQFTQKKKYYLFKFVNFVESFNEELENFLLFISPFALVQNGKAFGLSLPFYKSGSMKNELSYRIYKYNTICCIEGCGGEYDYDNYQIYKSAKYDFNKTVPENIQKIMQEFQLCEYDVLKLVSIISGKKYNKNSVKNWLSPDFNDRTILFNLLLAIYRKLHLSYPHKNML